MKEENRSVRQLKNFVIALFNLVYNLMPFFTLKKIVLLAGGIGTGRKTFIHTRVRFFGLGKLKIGNNTSIDHGCYLDNRVGIDIGSNVSIAHDTRIYTLGHDIDDPFFGAKGATVTIGDYACIFSNVLIMPGVKIGKGAVVYPGSVVVKKVADYAVVGGNPAKFIRKRKKDLRYQLNYGFWFTV